MGLPYQPTHATRQSTVENGQFHLKKKMPTTLRNLAAGRYTSLSSDNPRIGEYNLQRYMLGLFALLKNNNSI